MKNRPVEKMLHPSSMHDYCEMAAKFGFTPFDREPDFDQDAFRKQLNEIKHNVKKDSSFQRVRTKYPDLLLNSKGTSRISISKGGDAVYPLVRILAPGFWHRNIEEDMPDSPMHEHVRKRLPPVEEGRRGIEHGKGPYHEVLVYQGGQEHEHVHDDQVLGNLRNLVPE